MDIRRVLIATAAGALLLVTACSDDDSGAKASTTTMASTTSTTERASTTTTKAAPVFPAARTTLEHGGDAWAVVLAGAEDSDAPELQAAVAAAKAAGYNAGPGDCDQGAAEALGLDPGVHRYYVSVYFLTKGDATTALASFHAAGQAGGAVGLVQTYCLD